MIAMKGEVCIILTVPQEQEAQQAMEGHEGKWPSRSDGREEKGDVGRRLFRVSLRRHEQSKVNKRYGLMIYPFLLRCLICWRTNVLVVSFGSLYFSGKSCNVFHL